jgi:hypothetical protein
MSDNNHGPDDCTPVATAPRVPAYRRGRHLYVICPYCQAGHLHGIAGGDGARSPHCLTPGPRRDYVLVTAGLTSKEFLDDWRRRRAKALRRWQNARGR